MMVWIFETIHRIVNTGQLIKNPYEKQTNKKTTTFVVVVVVKIFSFLSYKVDYSQQL